MIVKSLNFKGESGSEELLTVYGIYWIKGGVYFLVSPKKYDGLTPYSQGDVEVVDSHLSAQMLFIKSSGGTEMILHESLCDGLLDDVLEYDPAAYKKFVEKLGCEP